MTIVMTNNKQMKTRPSVEKDSPVCVQYTDYHNRTQKADDYDDDNYRGSAVWYQTLVTLMI